MWIFTKQGLISVVQNKDNPNEVVVRSRNAGALHSFIRSTVPICPTPKSDYQFRSYITKALFAKLLSVKALEIDYPNFKNSISDWDYYSLLTEIWIVCKLWSQK